MLYKHTLFFDYNIYLKVVEFILQNRLVFGYFSSALLIPLKSTT